MSRFQVWLWVLTTAVLIPSEGCSDRRVEWLDEDAVRALEVLRWGSAREGGCGVETGVAELDHQLTPLPHDSPVRFRRVLDLSLPAECQGYRHLAICADGKTVAAVCGGGHMARDVVHLFGVDERRGLHSLEPLHHNVGSVTAIAFLPPDERLLIANVKGGKKAYVYLWDIRSGSAVQWVEVPDAGDEGITGIAPLADGRRILLCARTGLFVWDLQAGHLRQLSLEDHVVLRPGYPPQRPYCDQVASAGYGSRFVTRVGYMGVFEPRLLVWDAKTMVVTKAIVPYASCVRVAIAPDGTTLAGSYPCRTGRGTCVTVWDAATGSPRASGLVFSDAREGVLTYSRDGNYLFAVGTHLGMGPPMQGEAYEPWALGVWELATGKLAGSLSIKAIYLQLALSEDSKWLVVGNWRKIHIYRIEYAGDSKAGEEGSPAKP